MPLSRPTSCDGKRENVFADRAYTVVNFKIIDDICRQVRFATTGCDSLLAIAVEIADCSVLRFLVVNALTTVCTDGPEARSRALNFAASVFNSFLADRIAFR